LKIILGKIGNSKIGEFKICILEFVTVEGR